MSFRARTALLIVLLSMAVTVSVSAQIEYSVVELEVVGNRVATNSLILGVASINKGAALTPAVIQNTIHRLYGLGIFRDVRINAEEVPGGLKVYIIVEELPKLVGLEFSGNKKISSDDLKKDLGLGVGGYISPFLTHQKKQKILDKYAEKGYFQATVEPELTYNEDSTEASLSYKIDEKSKVKVEKVIITGNSQVEANDLIKKMRNRKRGFLKSSTFAQEKFAEDKEKIITEYHKKGFIDAFLISDSMTIDTATNRMTIFLDVYEGPRYYFGNATFEGTEVLPADFLATVLKHKAGEPFNSEDYDESLYELYSAYQEIGHLHIRVIDERTTRADSIIDVNYLISEGQPSHINLVNIVGNTKTKEKVIRREIPVRPGQVFNRSLLIRSVREVMALNFFTNVEPVPLNLPNGDVDLEFRVEEKQTGQISAGAGYNSQDKMVGTVGMGIPNFRGNGQNLSFNVDFGSRRNSFSVSFTEPWMFGRPTLLGIDVFALNRTWYSDYTEARRGGSLRLGRRLRWPDNYFRMYVSYRLERNRFYDYDDNFEALNSSNTAYRYRWTEVSDSSTIENRYLDSTHVGEPLPGSIVAYNEEWNTASRVSFNIIRDSRNLPEFATKGSIISYSYEKTGGFLGGFWSYQKHRIKLAKFIPLIGNLALATRVEYGALIGRTDDPRDRRILVSERFNPGGTAFDGTVRGYEDGTLTPDSLVYGSDTVLYYYTDPDLADHSQGGQDSIYISPGFSTRVRGKYMLIANAELQFPVVPNQIYALLFLDAGNSWLHLHDVKPITGLYKGYGIGFRIAVPGIGTIGFDFAKPMDDPPDGSDRSWKPHFQIGTTIR
ncbi:MAG: outer membrane protein assembly factor BamA [candidate division Zixibacteria bacterium]|nr:outer membrane protein assembly factor BamA [candidate division Zixibacteria bacterium]